MITLKSNRLRVRIAEPGEAPNQTHRFDRAGFISEGDWGAIADASNTLSKLELYIDDSPGLSILEARAKARRELRRTEGFAANLRPTRAANAPWASISRSSAWA